MKILFTLCLSLFCFTYGQSINNFEYLNPLPGSKYVSPETNIIIKPSGIIDKTTVNSNLISVIGEQSGIHEGKFLLSDDSRTLVFNPFSKFSPYEKVTVKLNDGIRTIQGKDIGLLSFEFFINRESKPDDIEKINDEQGAKLPVLINKKNFAPSALDDIPSLRVNSSDNPSPGYLFLGPSPYLMIVDNEATPVFYRNVAGGIYNFTLQPNGELTYFIYPIDCYGLDSSLNIIRKFTTANGYSVDVHDLRVMPNGHYFILGKKLVDVDMSKIVPNGDSNAVIIDMALQEIDSTGNVVFQWSALDHYKITDADEYISLTQHQIDFVHLNSIEIDTDGNILLSARNLDEITKIDHNTGNIIWRLGGENNQFTFTNDERGFSRQHDVRRISNGDITIFDNGVNDDDQYSSMIEYSLDEQNKTVTLVNRYSHDNNIFSRTEGCIEELPNGNKLISWGNVNNPALTEIKPDNSIAYELSFGNGYTKYHSYRFMWKTNLFTTNVDSLDFGKVEKGDSVKKNITLYNPHDSDVVINEFYCNESSFSVLNKLPISIPEKDSVIITVKFNPQKNGVFTNNLNIRYVDNKQLIGRQVSLRGSTIDLINPINHPLDLKAFTYNDEIKLTWKDNSDNENGFIIERKRGDSSSTNDFAIIDTVSANDTLFIDNSIKDSVDYTYRIFAFNNDTTSSFSNYVTANVIVSVSNFTNIKQYILFQNYPNPFNPSTNIRYQIPKAGLVTISIYNIIGQKIKTLLKKFQGKGSYSIIFNASNLTSGIYFYKINVNQFTDVKKLILIK